MSFGINYDDAATGSDLLPKGDYEVVIKYAGEDATKGGTVYINVTMVIRNDVDQQYKNKYIWHSIWQKKEPSAADIGCGGYSYKQIQSLSKAAGLPNGKKYESLASWCEELKDKVVRVTIDHEEYKGEMQARVKWVNESKFPQCSHAWKKAAPDINPPAQTETGADYTQVQIDNNDDLPF